MDSQHALFLSASETPRILPGSTITDDRDLFLVVPEGTFYGDPDANVYESDQLFEHLSRLTQEGGVITEEIIRTGFLTVVRGAFPTRNLIAAVGSCCLVGVIWNRTLYVANLGDSRAVLAYLEQNKMVSEQLTIDHNAKVEEVGNEVLNVGPDDPQIVVQVGGAWRIKGVIKVCRAIGVGFLGSTEFGQGSGAETEDGFSSRSAIAPVGSCCLVGVIWKGTLYVANFGASGRVFALWDRSNHTISEVLTIDDNANSQGVLGRKDIIQVCRAISLCFLKRAELAGTATKIAIHLPPGKRFLIFAKDDLLEYAMNPHHMLESSAEEQKDMDWVPDFPDDFDFEHYEDNQYDGSDPDFDSQEIDYDDEPAGSSEDDREDQDDSNEDDSSDDSSDEDDSSDDDEDDSDESSDDDEDDSDESSDDDDDSEDQSDSDSDSSADSDQADPDFYESDDEDAPPSKRMRI